ncbi:hypothetical protein Nmel_012040, partial [Mimus melanotis]
MDTIGPVVVWGLGWLWLWDPLLMEMAALTGGNHCWTPALPGSMESLTRGARIGLTGIWLRPHSGSCRRCLEPGCRPGLVLRCPGVTAVSGGLSPGTGMGPGPSHTQHWTLLPPQPAAPPLPGPSPGGMLRDLPRAGQGAVWSSPSPGVSCSINEPLC